MAIDTTNEKLAIMEFGQAWEPGLPLSPSTLGQDDKQQLLHGFPDVLWAAPPISPITTINGKLAIMEFGQFWEPGLPMSPGSLGQDDKQQLILGFPEVMWATDDGSGASTLVKNRGFLRNVGRLLHA